MYESKLPGDIKKRKAAAKLVTRTLDRDLREKKLTERVVPYSDKTFHQAAIEWLVASDQVCSFLRVLLSFNMIASICSQYWPSNIQNLNK
jgi:hypothetical protein